MGHYAGSMPWKGLLCGQTLHGVVYTGSCAHADGRTDGRTHHHHQCESASARRIWSARNNVAGAKTSLDFVFVAVTEGLAPREIKINL